MCRDKEQAKNFKKKMNITSFSSVKFGQNDELLQCMERCKAARKGEEFTREVCGAPEPRCVLADNWQLTDIATFCCAMDWPNNTIMGLDPTFNLGAFYATFSVYRHPALEHCKTGRNPLFLGPVFVHESDHLLCTIRVNKNIERKL